MKKLLFLPLLLLCGMLYAQTNVTVSLDDEVYGLLKNCEIKGYCSALAPEKPYTEKYIVERLEEAADYLEDNFDENELIVDGKNYEDHVTQNVKVMEKNHCSGSFPF